MASSWRLRCKTSGLISTAVAAALLSPACQFDTSLDLQNNTPCFNADTVFRATVRYPDSSLCTLRVQDLNDSALAFGVCFSRDSTDTVCPDPEPWPWQYHWSGDLPGTASLCLSLDPCSLGFFSGFFHIADTAGAACTLPFVYTVALTDSLNRYPLPPNIWEIEPAEDSAFVGLDFFNQKVRFSFPPTGDATPASTGLCSRFALAGDLETSIRFQLRDDMRDGFEVSFRISTSPLSGPWDGDKTGFAISGLQSHVRFTCASVNMQTDSRDISRNFQEFAGYLNITRRGDSVGYQFVPGDPQLPVIPMNRFVFPGDKAVYVHIRMSVDDRLRTRHCLWSDFRVKRGRVRL
jgi:hypothetical protein